MIRDTPSRCHDEPFCSNPLFIVSLPLRPGRRYEFTKTQKMKLIHVFASKKDLGKTK
jgi:hypothetical protein